MIKSDWRFNSSAGQVVKTKQNQCHFNYWNQNCTFV